LRDVAAKDGRGYHNEAEAFGITQRRTIMTKLTLDPQLRAKLNGLNEQIEVCDETGKTVGHFLPEAVYRKFIYAWLNAQVTDEELEQAAQEPGGCSLAEIWKKLGRT
jgi:hypothetical protein